MADDTPRYTAAQVFNAIYGQESGYGANTATSPTGARGPMQIEPATFTQYARPGEQIDNANDNRNVGMRIITDYMSKYGNDPGRVATAYFSGPGNVAPMAFASPFREDKSDGHTSVSQYVNQVLARLKKGVSSQAPAVASSPTNATPAQAQTAQTQTAQPPSMGSMIGQALANLSTPSGGGLNTSMMAQAAPPGPGPQLAFRAAADDAAQASNLTAGGLGGAGAPGQPGGGAPGMTGLLGLMADPTAQTPIQMPSDVPMVGMSGLLYGGGAGLGVRHPAVTRLT